jgi:hypothetical protein
VLETDDVLFTTNTGLTGAVNALFAIDRLTEVPHAGLVPHGFATLRCDGLEIAYQVRNILIRVQQPRLIRLLKKTLFSGDGKIVLKYSPGPVSTESGLRFFK